MFDTSVTLKLVVQQVIRLNVKELKMSSAPQLEPTAKGSYENSGRRPSFAVST